MRIVIFHYHLNPGGVTRIIESQVEAIRQVSQQNEILVLTGACENDSVFRKNGVEVLINPELNYLTDTSDLETKYNRITRFLQSVLTDSDILHFHNLNLGKNPILTLAVSKLANDGAFVLNHAHDFSEDRPANMQLMKEVIAEKFKENLDEIMYPKLQNYRFVTLNSFDLKRLNTYGVEASRCNLMPNPVVFKENQLEGNIDSWKKEISNQLGLSPDKLTITYPVRVIRRKNIAEFVLLAVIFSETANWVVTQPPQNPIEKEHYDAWKEFCHQQGIEIFWEAGTKVDFEKLIRSSDFCISTSIQEGFGMVFMEPWLLGTAVVGRNIPMVTVDMKESGMRFPGLYDYLEIDEETELHELSIEEQMEFIHKLLVDIKQREKLVDRNSWIKNLLIPADAELLAANKSVILEKFSLSNYGERLNEVYRRIIK